MRLVVVHDCVRCGCGRQLKTIDFTFEDLGLKLRSNGHVVLQGVTGSIRHGRLTAVMGPSGYAHCVAAAVTVAVALCSHLRGLWSAHSSHWSASMSRACRSGKTTFLTALASRAYYGHTTGTIKMNGRVDSVAKYKKLVGFVPQEDVMLRELTVHENLMHSALTRLPAFLPLKTKQAVVAAVIDALGLGDCVHSTIGDEDTRGISGVLPVPPVPPCSGAMSPCTMHHARWPAQASEYRYRTRGVPDGAVRGRADFRPRQRLVRRSRGRVEERTWSPLPVPPWRVSRSSHSMWGPWWLV